MTELKILPNGRTVDEFCQECGLWEKCKSPRMEGEGAKNPTWLFIGEAPGQVEDEKGVPFVGDSGRELRKGIEEIGIDIQKCRFSNVCRCRPPGNKLSAYPKAIKHCRVHILREIRATNPKVIVLLGSSAVQSILNRTGILRLHGEVIKTPNWTFVCSFHPAYLLRNDNIPTRKRFLEALRVAKRMAEPKRKSRKLKRKNEYIRDKKMLQEYTDMLRKQPLLSTDIESSTLSPFLKGTKEPKVGCVGFAWDYNNAVCFPVEGRAGAEAEITVRKEEVLEAVKDIWEDPGIKHVAHFGKTLEYVYMIVLHDIWLGGRESRGYYADTGLMSYTLNEEKGGHGLKDWGYAVGMPDYDLPKRQYCLENPQHDPERGGNLIYAPAVSVLYPYNTDDCIAGYRLFFKLEKQLKKEKLWELPFKFPLMWHNWTAAMMEIAGIKIDKKRNVDLQDIYSGRIQKLDGKLLNFPEVQELKEEIEQKMLCRVYERVRSYKYRPISVKKRVLELYEAQREKLIKEKGSTINLNSTEVRRELVFEKLGYKSIKKTDGGLYSVDKEVLEELQKIRKNKVLGALVKRNELFSANSKYIAPIVEWCGLDGKTHTTYRPQGTVTGRVSSDHPNHENLPKRSKLAMELRTQFVSSGDGYFILEQDEKQMELRLMADRSQDETMISEFNSGKDPHQMGAAAAYEIREEDVTKEQRTDAKSAISFGLVYGRSAKALAADFGWSEQKAQKFKSRYFGKYQGVARYLEQRRHYILGHGVVYSHFFRRRHCRGYDSEDDGIRNTAVREGINSPIQGDASDVTWVAGHRFAEWAMKYRMKSKLIIAVHDALYIDYWYKELDDVLEMSYKFMTDREFIQKRTGWFCTVPWDTDISLGLNLGEMQELEHRKKPGEFIVPPEFK